MDIDIKDILDEIKDSINETPKRMFKYNKIAFNLEECQVLFDCITNLQKETENLREDNYAYHQLIRMENKREYRSKFLKDFQKEYGTNTYPDYDEIYKRYDKMKSRIDKVSNKIKTIFKEENWYETYEYNDLEQALKEIDYIVQGGD